MDIMFDQQYAVLGDEVPIKLGFKDVIFVFEDVDAASGAPSAAGASALDCFFSNAGIAFMRYAMASDTTNSRSVNLFS